MCAFNSDRLREHPEQRFADEQQDFDLHRAALELAAEPGGEHGHKQKALFRHGPMTVGLWVFEQDGCLPDHILDGDVLIQVLDGVISVRTHESQRELRPGQLLVIGPNIRHDLCALQPSKVLMTFCLETCQREQERARSTPS